MCHLDVTSYFVSRDLTDSHNNKICVLNSEYGTARFSLKVKLIL
jgi:hypothetical protein